MAVEKFMELEKTFHFCQISCFKVQVYVFFLIIFVVIIHVEPRIFEILRVQRQKTYPMHFITLDERRYAFLLVNN